MIENINNLKEQEPAVHKVRVHIQNTPEIEDLFEQNLDDLIDTLIELKTRHGLNYSNLELEVGAEEDSLHIYLLGDRPETPRETELRLESEARQAEWRRQAAIRKEEEERKKYYELRLKYGDVQSVVE